MYILDGYTWYIQGYTMYFQSDGYTWYWIYHVYTRHMREVYIYVVYTRHIPGIYRKSGFQMRRQYKKYSTPEWSSTRQYDALYHLLLPGTVSSWLKHAELAFKLVLSDMLVSKHFHQQSGECIYMTDMTTMQNMDPALFCMYELAFTYFLSYFLSYSAYSMSYFLT